MPNWRRAYMPGGSYFFTVVTDRRARFLCQPHARASLANILRQCRQRWPFAIKAFVLLPDHLHTIWSLPPTDNDYAKRWGWIKKEFTKAWLASGGTEQWQTAGRLHDRRRGVWQPKFWEHLLQTEHDFARHFDYIHYNPVKHGVVQCPHEWPWSSFRRWVSVGVYPVDWACKGEGPLFDDIEDTVEE